MAIEWLTGSLAYSFAKDLIGGIISRLKPMPPQKKLELRQKWKPLFEEHIRDHFVKKLRSDVIIRDVKRLDQYPDVKENEKTISAWFRLGLVGTYHRGILVAFQWNMLVEVGAGEFRFLDSEKDSQETKDKAIKVLQIGMIPFENIEQVDFDGDEYYNYPHIYCHFTIKGGPYERVAYFTQNQLFENSLPYHTEIVEAKSVQKTSKRLGIKSPYF
jgi:hypothetical protein